MERQKYLVTYTAKAGYEAEAFVRALSVEDAIRQIRVSRDSLGVDTTKEIAAEIWKGWE